MWTIPFNTIGRRGCRRAWTCLAALVLFCLGNSCFRGGGPANGSSPGRNRAQSLLSRVCSQLLPCLYIPSQCSGGSCPRGDCRWPWCPWGVGCTFDFPMGCWHVLPHQGAKKRSSAGTDEPHDNALTRGRVQGSFPLCALWQTDCRVDPMKTLGCICLSVEGLKFLELL